MIERATFIRVLPISSVTSNLRGKEIIVNRWRWIKVLFLKCLSTFFLSRLKNATSDPEKKPEPNNRIIKLKNFSNQSVSKNNPSAVKLKMVNHLVLWIQKFPAPELELYQHQAL